MLAECRGVSRTCPGSSCDELADIQGIIGSLGKRASTVREVETNNEIWRLGPSLIVRRQI